MSWRLITYRLPAEPSRHRVAVWRELPRPGGVVKAITAAGGQPVVLAVADDPASTAQLEALFTEQREADRLRRWYRTIRTRGLFGTPSAAAAERRLQECAEALDQFAGQVYQARDRP